MIELLFPSINSNHALFLELLINIADVLFFVLLVVGEWHVLKKFNDKPWKALIPVYNIYTIFKHVWKRSAFWIYAVAHVGFAVFLGVSEGIALRDPENFLVDLFLVIALPFAIVLIVYTVLSNIRTAEAFGKGILYGLALSVFYEIFILVLGLSKAECVYDNAVPAKVAEAESKETNSNETNSNETNGINNNTGEEVVQ